MQRRLLSWAWVDESGHNTSIAHAERISRALGVGLLSRAGVPFTGAALIAHQVRRMFADLDLVDYLSDTGR